MRPLKSTPLSSSYRHHPVTPAGDVWTRRLTTTQKRKETRRNDVARLFGTLCCQITLMSDHFAVRSLWAAGRKEAHPAVPDDADDNACGCLDDITRGCDWRQPPEHADGPQNCHGDGRKDQLAVRRHWHTPSIVARCAVEWAGRHRRRGAI